MKTIRFIKAAFASAMAIALVPHAAAENPSSAEGKAAEHARQSYFAIMYDPGPEWKRGEPLSVQGLEEHGRYMRQLAQDGILILAGPLSTSEGGLVILVAGNLDEAAGIMARDPAVVQGKFVGRVSEWRPLIDPQKLLRPGGATR
ncbi:MAG: YciI family protein [Sphingopyxis sp.]